MLSLGTIQFFLDWPHHLDYIYFLYLSITSTGKKTTNQMGKIKWGDDTDPTGDR